MPRVFNKQYTRPVPEGAKRAVAQDRKGRPTPAVRFKGEGGKWVIAPLTRKGDRCRVTSPTYYGWVAGEAVPLCTNKAAAEVMLADLVRDAERRRAGLTGPCEEHRKRPLAELLVGYRAELEGRGNAP